MTSPDTQHSDATYGGPPNYPSSQQLPPEFWRKQPNGNPAHHQTITVDYGDHEVHHNVVPGWDNPVFIGPREDDPND